jgi:hypothetical protein
MSFDKITPLAAPPGHSLTNDPGRWPWDRPAEYANPDDAIDFIIAQLERPNSQDGLLKMMLGGISVEEIVSQIAFKGFMEGSYTPDVAELIKPALAIYLVGIADENDIDAQIFMREGELEEEEVTDATFFSILEQRNPTMFRAMNEEMNRRRRMEDQESREQATARPAPPPPSNFLEMPERGAS